MLDNEPLKKARKMPHEKPKQGCDYQDTTLAQSKVICFHF